jgi:putative phosphoesterase
MRVAAIFDLHGNLPALEAVLHEISQAEVDAIVVGGDVVAGPMPSETLDALLTLQTPVHYLQGNADREVLAQRAGTDLGAVPEGVLPIVRWVAGKLAAEQAQQMADWPATVRLTIAGLGEVLFCHATPRSDTEVFTRLTPEAQIAEAFAEVEADLVVCGHTHMPFERQIGAVRVVNAGSVGMPYGPQGACWLLLGPTVEFRRTAYDYVQAAGRIRATDYPQAAEFAAENVLQVPSEAEALAVLTQMERKQPLGRETPG